MLNVAHPAPSARQASERNSKSSTGFAQPLPTLFCGAARELDRYRPSPRPEWIQEQSKARTRSTGRGGEMARHTVGIDVSKVRLDAYGAPRGRNVQLLERPRPRSGSCGRESARETTGSSTSRPVPGFRSLRVGCGRISTSRRSVPRREMRKEMSCESWSRCRISRRSMHSSGARAEFLAIASHDSAPLASIKGSTATVIGAVPVPPQAELLQFFRIIDGQADLMRCLISNLPVSPETRPLLQAHVSLDKRMSNRNRNVLPGGSVPAPPLGRCVCAGRLVSVGYPFSLAAEVPARDGLLAGGVEVLAPGAVRTGLGRRGPGRGRLGAMPSASRSGICQCRFRKRLAASPPPRSAARGARPAASGRSPHTADRPPATARTSAPARAATGSMAAPSDRVSPPRLPRPRTRAPDAGGGAASPRAAPPRPLPPGLLRSPAAAPTRDPSPSGCTPSAPLPDMSNRNRNVRG